MHGQGSFNIVLRNSWYSSHKISDWFKRKRGCAQELLWHVPTGQRLF